MSNKYDTESIRELIEAWQKDLPEWIFDAQLDELIELLNEFISS